MIGAAIVVTTLNQLTISIVMITIRYFGIILNGGKKKFQTKKYFTPIVMTPTQDKF